MFKVISCTVIIVKVIKKYSLFLVLTYIVCEMRKYYVPFSGMILSSEYTIETIGIIKHFYSNLCFFGSLGIINLFD